MQAGESESENHESVKEYYGRVTDEKISLMIHD